MRLRVAAAPGSLRTAEDDEEMRDEASVAAIGRRAHIDSARKSKTVKKGMRRRARDRGKLSGCPRPFAYRRLGPHLENRLVQVSQEVPVVERIFRNYVAGTSQMAIAQAHNADHVPYRQGRGVVPAATTPRVPNAGPSTTSGWRILLPRCPLDESP